MYADSEKEHGTSKDQNGRQEEAVPIKCKPCKRRNLEAMAEYFCSFCQENLCDTCEEYHRSFGVTKNHIVRLLNVQTETFPRDNILLCWSCEKHAVEMFCEIHNDVVCLTCCQSFHTECATLKLKKNNEHNLPKITDDRAKLTCNRLRTVETSVNQERSKLQCKIDICSNQILVFFEELRDFLDKLKSNTLKHLEQLESEEKRKMDKCITFCVSTCQDIDNRMRSLQEQDMSDDTNKLLMQALKMLRFLKQVEREVEEMQKDICFFPIEFVKHRDLVKFMIDNSDLGEIQIKL